MKYLVFSVIVVALGYLMLGEDIKNNKKGVCRNTHS